MHVNQPPEMFLKADADPNLISNAYINEPADSTANTQYLSFILPAVPAAAEVYLTKQDDHLLLEIDDLDVAETEQARGYGTTLLAWIVIEGKSRGAKLGNLCAVNPMVISAAERLLSSGQIVDVAYIPLVFEDESPLPKAEEAFVSDLKVDAETAKAFINKTDISGVATWLKL
ncbi:MAG TPA: hypothetical protein VFN31_02405 [Candidatus Saccharimonadales bacterium]|nr:hypothetical protein [Candidatus Saccharimonadales bacterium]